MIIFFFFFCFCDTYVIFFLFFFFFSMIDQSGIGYRCAYGLYILGFDSWGSWQIEADNNRK